MEAAATPAALNDGTSALIDRPSADRSGKGGFENDDALIGWWCGCDASCTGCSVSCDWPVSSVAMGLTPRMQ